MKKKRSNGVADKHPAAVQVATRRKLSTREIVAATGLSQQRIQQRRARGETAQEIIAAVQARKQSERVAVAEEKLHRGRISATTPAPLSYSTRRKAESDAELKSLELRRRRGELVEASQIMLWMSACTIGALQAFEHIEDLADLIVNEPDVLKVRALLRRGVEAALLVLEGHGITISGAVSVSPIDPALPSEVKRAIRVIGKYSISLAGGGK